MASIARAQRVILAVALLLCAGAARAIQSSSVDFTNTRSAMSSGGLRKTSASFRIDGSIGSLAQTAETSAHFRGRDGLIPGYYYPSNSTVIVSTIYTNGTASIEWISPGNDGNEHSTPGGYIVRYSSVASQSPALSDALFDAAANVTPAPPAAAVQGTTVTMTVTGLTPGAAYYFAMKTYERDGTRSVLSKTILYLNLPQEPYGIALTTAAFGNSLRWMPVVRFADGVSFAASSAPTPSELNGYHVYRATAAILAPWTDVADLSTATLTWTDFTAGGGPYYYSVSASNNQGISAPSVVRSAADMSAYVVAPDGVSYFQVLAPNVAPVEGVVGNPNSAYLLTSSNRPQDLGMLNGRVVKSVEFDAYQGGVLLAPNFPIPGQGILHLNYQSAVSTGAFPSGIAATETNMSTYWYNGVNWVQLYGTIDTTDQIMSIKTVFIGQYQMRTVERTGGFSFNMAGVSNRFVTPNGDHHNDNVVFTFDNPRNSAVSAKILDLRGRTVASNLALGPQGTSLVWDGTSGGRPRRRRRLHLPDSIRGPHLYRDTGRH
ncbi:MAG: fibronectin type III domain-containing protein [Elusimicrobiota bacterium]